MYDLQLKKIIAWVEFLILEWDKKVYDVQKGVYPLEIILT